MTSFQDVRQTLRPRLAPWAIVNMCVGFFGIQINQAPTKEFQAMRIAPACFLKGTVLGQEVRIIDDNTCVAALNFFGKKVDVVIRGVETKGLADAASPTPPGMYYVRGTVMLNNRTLFELVPFAPTPEEVAAIAAPPKQ